MISTRTPRLLCRGVVRKANITTPLPCPSAHHGLDLTGGQWRKVIIDENERRRHGVLFIHEAPD